MLPGKRFWLELKTTEWSRSRNRHELSIRLAQLANYGDRTKNRLGIPDYYVFPVPPWSGTLSAPTALRWLAPNTRSDLGYRARSHDKWFAEWLYVVSGDDLRRRLSTRLKRWARGGRKVESEMRIATVAPGSSLMWSPLLRGLVPLHWKSFWESMERCGGPSLPAQFIIPAPGPGTPPIVPGTNASPNVTPTQPAGGAQGRAIDPSNGSRIAQNNANADAPSDHRAAISRDALVRTLAELSFEKLERGQRPLELYSPNLKGGYEIVVPPRRPAKRTAGEFGDHRSLITIELGALKLT